VHRAEEYGCALVRSQASPQRRERFDVLRWFSSVRPTPSTSGSDNQGLREHHARGVRVSPLEHSLTIRSGAVQAAQYLPHALRKCPRRCIDALLKLCEALQRGTAPSVNGLALLVMVVRKHLTRSGSPAANRSYKRSRTCRLYVLFQVLDAHVSSS